MLVRMSTSPSIEYLRVLRDAEIVLNSFRMNLHLSSVENHGWLFDIGDYTPQLYGDYNKLINKDPYYPRGIQWNVNTVFITAPLGGYQT